MTYSNYSDLYSNVQRLKGFAFGWVNLVVCR